MSVLRLVTAAMEQIAPLAMADRAWDNVGLLLEHPRANEATPKEKRRVLLTIDLTEVVLEECIKHSCSVIVAYHPPIFVPMKRLSMQDVKQRIVLRAIEHGISIYSPHTSLDAAEGGINDWLADLLGNTKDRVPITPVLPDGRQPRPEESAGVAGGYGRVVTMTEDITAKVLVDRVKSGLGLPTLRVAVPEGFSQEQKFNTVGICAGSGSSVLKKPPRPCDVLLTGEMSHHEVLAATATGTLVLLAEHTNTERGYLKQRLAPRLRELLSSENVEVVVSEVDTDPLVVW